MPNTDPTPQRPRHAQAQGDVPVSRVFDVSHPDQGSGVAAGTVTQGIPATVVDEHGALPPGALCILVDHALGTALIEAIDHDQRMVTSHMHLELVREIVAGTTAVSGQAEDVNIVPGSGFARGRIMGPDGDLLALISTRFALFDADLAQGGAVASSAGAAVEADEPRQVAPAIDHALASAPIDTVLGTAIETAEDGRAAVSFLASADLANERDGLHGGVGALMAERAANVALRSATPGRGYRPVEMRVVFLRPVPAAGGRVHSDAQVTFLGRSTASTTARLYRADGKTAVQIDIVYVRTSDR